MGKMRWGKEVAASQCKGANDNRTDDLQSRLYLHSHDFIYTVTQGYRILRVKDLKQVIVVESGPEAFPVDSPLLGLLSSEQIER
jgi:hypothetical protein